MTSEQQERMRRNREIALAKRKAAQEKQAEQDNSQTRQTGKACQSFNSHLPFVRFAVSSYISSVEKNFYVRWTP